MAETEEFIRFINERNNVTEGFIDTALKKLAASVESLTNQINVAGAKKQIIDLLKQDQNCQQHFLDLTATQPELTAALFSWLQGEITNEKLTEKLTENNDEGFSGFEVFAVKRPDILKQVLESLLKGSNQQTRKVIDALCAIDRQPGIATVAYTAHSCLESIFNHANFNQRDQLITALCHHYQQGENTLLVIAMQAPKHLTSAFDLAVTTKQKTQIIKSLCEKDENRNTIFSLMAHYAPKQMLKLINSARTQEQKKMAFEMLLETIEHDKKAFLSMAEHAPDELVSILNSIAEAAPEGLVDALCTPDEEHNMALSVIVSTMPDYLQKLINLVHLHNLQDTFITALSHKNSRGRSVFEAITDKAPDDALKIIEKVKADTHKKELQRQYDNHQKTHVNKEAFDKFIRYLKQAGYINKTANITCGDGFRLGNLSDKQSAWWQAVLSQMAKWDETKNSLASQVTVKDQKIELEVLFEKAFALLQNARSTKNQLLKAFCQLDENNYSGLAKIAYYLPDEVFKNVLALATTKKHKQKVFNALSQRSQDDCTGFDFIVEKHAPENLSLCYNLAENLPEKFKIFKTIISSWNPFQIQTICKKLGKAVENPVIPVLYQNVPELCTKENLEKIEQNTHLELAILTVCQYLNSKQFSLFGAHGYFGKRASQTCLKHLLQMPENTDGISIQKEIEHWVNGCGLFSFASNNNEGSRRKIASERGLFQNEEGRDENIVASAC